MRLQAGAATDRGRVRKLNEDIYVSRAGQGLFLICDGMGGAPAGEVASQIAIDAILARLDASPALDGVSTVGRGYLPQTRRLADAVRQSNRIVYDHAQSDPSCARMGTTFVGAWITQHIASVAHVGDSRAYLWHEDQLEPLTRDHSLVEAHVAAGLLNPDEAVHSNQQNILVRVLGREPEVDVDLKEVAVQPGDFLLLCSDGLTRMVSDDLLGQAIVRLRHPQRICDYLVETANAGGGTDNITVVVVEVTNRLWQRLALFWR
jgi:serine/threonine protein phosphatase PrpC